MRTSRSISALTTLLVVFLTTASHARQAAGIERQGYLGSPLVEVTPFVFGGRLYRLENNQKFWDLEGAAPGVRFHEDEVRIRDVESDEVLSVALTNHAFATALVHSGQTYVFADDFGQGKGWRQITRINTRCHACKEAGEAGTETTEQTSGKDGG